MRSTAWKAAAWVTVVFLAFYLTRNDAHETWSQFAQSEAQVPPGPTGIGVARDVPLPGGGVSDGSHCGVKGYHYFPQAPGWQAAADAALSGANAPGPQLALGSYGGGNGATGGPWRFTLSFGIGPGLTSGSKSGLELGAPLGAKGLAIEIEGPDGLVLGAHDVPFTLHGATVGPDHRILISPTDDVSADVSLPLEALCAGVDAGAVLNGMSPPIDGHNTVTGQPPYVLTVSFSDPAVAALRAAVHAPASGPTLSGDNLDPKLTSSG